MTNANTTTNFVPFTFANGSTECVACEGSCTALDGGLCQACNGQGTVGGEIACSGEIGCHYCDGAGSPDGEFKCRACKGTGRLGCSCCDTMPVHNGRFWA